MTARTATAVVARALAGARIRYVDSNGLRHRVVTFNPQAERDVLFIPGITSPAETARFIADALPHLRLHVPDLRGRGHTDVSPECRYQLTDYRADAVGIIAALDLNDPVLVGHSLGARIIASVALATSPTAPVVLVDPPTSGPGRPPYPMSSASFLAQIDEAHAGTTTEQVRKYFPRWPEAELQLRAAVLPTCDPQAVAATHHGFEIEDFFPIWDLLDGDVTLIYGANSPVVPAEAVAELAERNTRVRITAVPDAGHMVPWDNLSGFVSALESAVTADPKNPAINAHSPK